MDIGLMLTNSVERAVKSPGRRCKGKKFATWWKEKRIRLPVRNQNLET
jgi:hypothetical protein